MTEMQQRLFTEPLPIHVRQGTGAIIYDKDIQALRQLGLNGVGPWPAEFTDEVAQVERIPRDHSGWQSIRYNKRRYQLFGGIRTAFFICLNSPI